MTDTDTNTDTGSIWATHAVPAGGSTSIAVGPLRIRLRRAGDELWVRTLLLPAGDAEPVDAGDGDWSRWALPEGAPEEIHLAPGLPDRLLVVRPRLPFHLAPGATARLHVRVPVQVQLRVGSREGPWIGEYPTILLSDTWWGDPESGELAFWLDTHARRSISADLFEPHMAVCTMGLVNRSRDPLPVTRVALRPVHLAIFGSPRGLWCEELRVTWDEGEEAQVEMMGRAPAEAEEPSPLAAPRIAAERGLRVRTFARLRGGGGA